MMVRVMKVTMTTMTTSSLPLLVHQHFRTYLICHVVYWRIDEGKGTTLENLTRADLSAEIETKSGSESQEMWNALDDGDPMEFEDKWGKKCPAQYSVNLQNEATNIKCVKKNWFTPSLTKFTLELWIKPQDSNGIILEIGQGTQYN